jgi:hypothetical protein
MDSFKIKLYEKERITGVISCADVGTRRVSTAHAARVMAWRRKVEDAIFQTS